MNFNRLISRPTLILVALSSLGLAACSADIEGYTASPTVSKRPVAEWTVSRLDIAFEPGKASLAAGEEARLMSALALEDPARPVRVVARTNAEGTAAALAVERASTLRQAAAAKGFKLQYHSQGAVVAENPLEPDSAAVFIGRYEVSVPGCPDWRKPMVTDFSNKESTNLGCANAINLALMLADPGDLNKGDAQLTSSGKREAAVIDQYYVGKQPRLAKPDLPNAGAAKTLTSQ